MKVSKSRKLKYNKLLLITATIILYAHTRHKNKTTGSHSHTCGYKNINTNLKSRAARKNKTPLTST